MSSILASSLNTDYYSDNIKISEDEDEYNAGGEWSEARTALQGSTNTDASIPESFIIELQATARENQISNVIKSTVNNFNSNSVATTPSIYDFQGKSPILSVKINQHVRSV